MVHFVYVFTHLLTDQEFTSRLDQFKNQLRIVSNHLQSSYGDYLNNPSVLPNLKRELETNELYEYIFSIISILSINDQMLGSERIDEILEKQDTEVGIFYTHYGRDREDSICINVSYKERHEASLYFIKRGTQTVLAVESIEDNHTIELEFEPTNLT